MEYKLQFKLEPKRAIIMDGINCHIGLARHLNVAVQSPVQKQRKNRINTRNTSGMLPSCIEINLMNNPQLIPQ